MKVESESEPGVAALPVVDVGVFLAAERDGDDAAGGADAAAADEQCQTLARSLQRYGAVLIRDARVSDALSEQFLDQMERYFAQPAELKMLDSRPELSYQVGVCPERTEVPRDHKSFVCSLAPSERPTDALGGADPKWRFFWRVGRRPASTAYPELHADAVVPRAFPGWAQVMDGWGYALLTTVEVVARMLAVGLGLPPQAIASKLRHGPHLLAPTGAQLARHSAAGTVLAGFHYDLNALTIHGRARFPGLFLWTSEGRRLACAVPPGCLLVQAGVQLEWLTAGAIRRGFHEVVVSAATQRAQQRAQADGRSTWRVSSTLFAHIASDERLEPLGHFAERREAEEYDGKTAGEQVREELRHIRLAST